MYFKTLFSVILIYTVLTYYLTIYYKGIVRSRRAQERAPVSNIDYSEEAYDTQVPKLFYHSPFRPGKYFSSREQRMSLREIVIVIVPCINRLEMSLNTIKSAIGLSSTPLRILIYTEDYYVEHFKTTLEMWKIISNSSFTFDIFEVTYPNLIYTPVWRNLTKNLPCATQRIFLPSMLKTVDAILYVETDVLFMSPVEDIWNLFNVMNSSHEVAMVRELDFHQPKIWYNKTALDPYSDISLLNPSVMLMNLTRMRNSYWTRRIMAVYWDNGQSINIGLKDVINLYALTYPGRLLELSPRYSFRTEYCNKSTLGYKDSVAAGIFVLHGAGEMFHNKSLIFTEIAKAWAQYTVGSEPYTNLYLRMKYMIKILIASKNYMRRSTDLCHEVETVILMRLHYLNLKSA